jgi:UDP-glucose 4-epimerase
VAGRRVLITGVANSFGARLARRLAADAGVERVVGVDTRPVDPALGERIDVVAVDLPSAELPSFVRAAAVDTVVHNDVVQFPEPGRPRASLHDINVIGTLQLLCCPRPRAGGSASARHCRSPTTAPPPPRTPHSC